MLRQIRSMGPMRAPCFRGLSPGHFMLTVYWVLFFCVPGTLAAPCLTCYGFQPGCTFELDLGRAAGRDRGDRRVALGRALLAVVVADDQRRYGAVATPSLRLAPIGTLRLHARNPPRGRALPGVVI